MNFNPVSLPNFRRGSAPSEIAMASLALNLLALAIPLSLMQVYDRILPNASLATLEALLALLICIVCADLALRIGRARLSSWAAAAAFHQNSNTLIKKILNTHPSIFSASAPGGHIDRLQAHDALRGTAAIERAQRRVDLPFLAVFLLLLAVIGGPLALVPILIGGGLLYAASCLTDTMAAHAEERVALDKRRAGFMMETLSAIHTVKGMAMELQILRRFERLQRQLGANTFASARLSGIADVIGHSAQTIAVGGVAAVGAASAIAGHLSLGGLAASVLISSRCMQPLIRIFNHRLRDKDVRHTRFDESQLALSSEAEVSESPAPVKPSHRRQSTGAGGLALECHNVTFRHAAAGPYLFEALSVYVPANQCAALHAPEGSGKTSFFRLLMGDLRPETGEIRLGGVAMTADSRAGLLPSIGYVPPEAPIFDGSILDNLCLFETGSRVDAVLEIANRIGLDQRVQRLSDGYDTRLGNGSSLSLSPGLRQQIGLVRVLARKPRLLLLDEATASLDAEADQGLAALLQMLKGQTTLLIASHRPSLLRLADQTIQLRPEAAPPAQGHSKREQVPA